jgi:hypothetical protein
VEVPGLAIGSLTRANGEGSQPPGCLVDEAGNRSRTLAIPHRDRTCQWSGLGAVAGAKCLAAREGSVFSVCL